MKDIIFGIVSLLVFIGGCFLFDYFQNKFEDSSWAVVICKIGIALILVVVYAIALKCVADYFNVVYIS